MNNTSQTIDHQSRLKNALLALREMRAKLDAMQHSKTEPIAIIGMGCRFPGAKNPQAFWSGLRDGVDSISEVPLDRWDINEYYDPNPDTPGKMYVRSAGFLEQVDQFEPQFFGITPREAICMDPQQRLLLEVSWEALEYGGIAPERLRNSETGVFVGITTNDYLQLQISGDRTNIDAFSTTGNCLNAVAGRLSYTLGLHGPSMIVDTACSSSLVAIHLACQSLRNQECELALAGGVNAILSPVSTIATCRARMLAPDGRCKTFDASADGFARGEGCGIVVLKRLSNAIADGDNILALIRGSAVNQDGPSSGLTVPNGIAQQALLRKALANALVEPGQVSYVEAHGTGTSLGDPIEVESLGAVLCQGRSKEQPLIIGSVKTNIGHLESAAGVAGVIKLVLALQNKEIPPHLHLKNPNPHIPWAELPVEVPTQRMPWNSANGPRIAGVSGFGVSGTNAHLVIEEAPARQFQAQEKERPLHLLTLSAKTEEALQELVTHFYTTLKTNPNLADVCFTANTGRSVFAHRLALVAKNSAQVCEQLAAYSLGQNSTVVLKKHVKNTHQPKIAFLFTGQGSQYVSIGRQLYEQAPTFRQALDRCDAILRPYLQQPLLSVLYPADGSDSPIEQTAYSQLALFALEYALSELWRSWGISPDAVMGDSVGEYVAACVAGVFSLEDGLKMLAGIDQPAAVTYNEPNIDLISITGQLAQPKQVSQASYWRHNVQKTAQFADGMQTLHAQGYELIVEIGPHPVLIDMRQSLPEKTGVWLPSLRRGSDDWQQLLESLATLYVNGVNVDWSGFDRDYQRAKLPLPTYPFQRQRYWVDKPAETPSDKQQAPEKTQDFSTSIGVTNLKDRILSIVAKTTGLKEDQLGLDMSLEGELGLDSLIMTQLMSDLVKLIPEEQKQAFSSKFTLRDLIQLQTLRQVIKTFEGWQPSGETDTNNFEDTVVVRPEELIVQQPHEMESVEMLHGQYFHLLGHWVVNSNSLFSSLRLHGTFDINVAWQSWKDLLSRHPMLRSRFHVPAGATRFKDYQMQVQEDVTPPDIPVTDIRHLDSDAQELAIQEELHKWLNYQWSMTQWPLHQFSVLRLGDCDYQLFLGNEHLISDALGNHIILREFMEIYRARICNDQPILPPPTTLKDYSEVVRVMNAWHDPEEDRALAEYTSSQGKDSYFWNPKGGIVDYPTPQFHSLRYRLGRETTSLLIAQTREWRLPVNSLLLGAFLRAVVKFEQSSKSAIVQIPTGGRIYPGADASHMVSSFAQNLALSFELPQPDEDWQVLLNRIHQEVQNGIANGQDRTQTRQMGTIFRNNIALEDGKIPDHSLSVFRSVLKSNLYFPYTGHTHIKTQYGPVEVTGYQAGGINAAGTVDILQEIFDDSLHLFASYDYKFFDLSVIDTLMKEYITQIEELTSLSIQPQQVTQPQAVSQKNLKIESQLRLLAEEICHYPISSEEMDKDLEADLGMDSLERIRIVTRLEKFYGKVDRQALLSCRSLQEMTNLLVSNAPPQHV
jgi:acyl transferase domain-containing protein